MNETASGASAPGAVSLRALHPHCRQRRAQRKVRQVAQRRSLIVATAAFLIGTASAGAVYGPAARDVLLRTAIGPALVLAGPAHRSPARLALTGPQAATNELGGGAASLRLAPTQTPSPSTSAVPGDGDPPAALAQAASQLDGLMITRTTSLSSGNLARWLSVVDPLDQAARVSQTRVFTTLRALPLAPGESWQQVGNFTFEASTSLTGSVEFRYALTGYDPAPSVTRERYSFVRRAGTWYLSGPVKVGGTLWSIPGTPTIVKRSTVLLLAWGMSSARSSQLADDAAAAVASVDRTVASVGLQWNRRVVVLMPPDTKVFTRDGVDPATFAGLTIAEVDPSLDYGVYATRVWLNPVSLRDEPRRAQQVLLRHEITHVATAAPAPTVPGRTVPLWLAEGLADIDGYSGSGLTTHDLLTATADLLARSGRAAVPSGLPTEAQYRGSSSDTVDRAYEGGWFACHWLDLTYGGGTAARLYAKVLALGIAAPEQDANARVPAAIKALTGLNMTQFLSRSHAALLVAAS